MKVKLNLPAGMDLVVLRQGELLEVEEAYLRLDVDDHRDSIIELRLQTVAEPKVLLSLAESTS